MRAQPSIPARFLRATVLAAIVALTTAGLASAKMPFFTVEIVPEAPIADEPVLVVVRMWADANHTSPAGWDLGRTMTDLVVFRSTDGNDSVPVRLYLVEPDRYEARVVLPAGDWTLVAFPDRSGWATPEVPAGYPDTIALTVRERAPDLLTLGIPLVAIALLVVAGYALNRLRSAALTRSSRVDETPTSASAAREASRASPIE
jgi:hypothetical protein